ncbi:MAG: hypothetical protein AB1529_05450 [Candidatus Micrarchaeota archaeon]
MSRPTFRIAPEARSAPGFSRETGRLKLAPDARSRAIEPDSREWNGLGMDMRLAGRPYLEMLIRSGRATLVMLPEPTSTCKDKARVAGLSAESVVRTLCCRETFVDGGKVYLVVSTAGERLDLPEICSQHDDLRYTELALAREVLPSMRPGTCTPFVEGGEMEQVQMLMVQAPQGGAAGRLVDVSIGGTDYISHFMSLSLRYGDLIESLSDAFGEKMRTFTLFCEERLPGRIREQLGLLGGNPRRPKRYAPRLKALRRLEGLAGGLDESGLGCVLAELHSVRERDGNALVREEAGRLASRLEARGKD